MAIRIPIISEFSDKGIKQAQYEFGKLDSNVQKAGYVLQRAILPAAAAFGTLTQVIGPAVQAASNMQESMSKVGVIFGSGAKQVTNFAQTAARELGQSKQAVLDAAGVFGTFGKAAGLAGTDLATFSNDFVKLATDLASFNNTSPEEAVQAIGAALRGEAEPLRRFGVLLDDATLKAEAMKLGIYDGSGALTAQQKILAAQAAIYKQTADAQGDFARTADGLANKQRTLSALIDNYQVQLGQQLLPKVNELVDLTLEAETAFANLPEPVKNSASAFNDLLGKITKLINPLASTLDIVKRIFGYFSDEETFGAYNKNLGVSATQQMRVADAAGIERRALLASNEAKDKGTKATKTLTEANKKLEEQIAKARTEIEQRLNNALSNAQSQLDNARNAYNSFRDSISSSITAPSTSPTPSKKPSTPKAHSSAASRSWPTDPNSLANVSPPCSKWAYLKALYAKSSTQALKQAHSSLTNSSTADQTLYAKPTNWCKPSKTSPTSSAKTQPTSFTGRASHKAKRWSQALKPSSTTLLPGSP